MNIVAFLFESVFGVSLVWVPILHALIVILFGIRLISVRRPVGVAFAWLWGSNSLGFCAKKILYGNHGVLLYLPQLWLEL